jgi:uncharacterized protein YndB with AHSA1/START domain
MPAILLSLCACLGAPADGAGGNGPEADLRPIEAEVLVRTTPAEAWKAWTTNEGARKWFAPDTHIELKPGGAFEILFSPDQPPGGRGAEGLKVLSYVPQEMLSFEWNAPPQFARARPQRTWVVVRFADVGEGRVRVRLSHQGFAERAAARPDEREEWTRVREYFARAWPRVLENLRKHLEGDAPAGDEGRNVTEGLIDAPVAAVWELWTTKKGLESCVVARAEIDLKVGGRMRTHYDARGEIGDPNTIENIILAYEPERMLTLRVGTPPEKFPFKEAVKSMWTVIYFEPVGPDRTRLRAVGLGFGGDEESKKMKAFFERGNAFTIKKVQEHFAKKAP